MKVQNILTGRPWKPVSRLHDSPGLSASGLGVCMSLALFSLAFLPQFSVAGEPDYSIPGAGRIPAHRFSWSSPDNRILLVSDSRVALDAAFYDEDRQPLGDGTDLRSGRAGVKARIGEDWGAELDIEFASGDSDFRDVWIAYGGFENSTIKIGQFKEPFSLEELTSSIDLMFMERSAANVLVPGRNLGIGYSRWGERWQVSLGVFGESVGDDDEDEGVDEGWGSSSRFTFVPVQTNRGMLHVGVSASFRKPDGNDGRPDEMRFRTANETAIADVEFLDTGRIRRVKDATGWGIEVAAAAGPVSFQLEQLSKKVQRESPLRDVDLSGGYAQVAWLSGAGHRLYDNIRGEFGGVATSGELAWEVAARYSWIDLTDIASDIRGGKSQQWTLGLSLYPNDNLRFMVNLSKVHNDRDANARQDAEGGENFGFIQARARVVF